MTINIMVSVIFSRYIVAWIWSNITSLILLIIRSIKLAKAKGKVRFATFLSPEKLKTIWWISIVCLTVSIFTPPISKYFPEYNVRNIVTYIMPSDETTPALFSYPWQSSSHIFHVIRPNVFNGLIIFYFSGLLFFLIKMILEYIFFVISFNRAKKQRWKPKIYPNVYVIYSKSPRFTKKHNAFAYKGCIYISPSIKRLPAHMSKFIIDHEIAHLKANDYFHRVLSQILTYIFWPNLLIHLTSKFYRVDQEILADNFALSQVDTEKTSYKKVKIDISKYLQKLSTTKNPQRKNPPPFSIASEVTYRLREFNSAVRKKGSFHKLLSFVSTILTMCPLVFATSEFQSVPCKQIWIVEEAYRTDSDTGERVLADEVTGFHQPTTDYLGSNGIDYTIISYKTDLWKPALIVLPFTPDLEKE